MNEEEKLANIALLMKRGRVDEIQLFMSQQSGAKEDEQFTSYIDELIRSKKMSRAKIAAQIGLSKDYMYKVLRGDKKTSERDYIIAICISMKATLLETQKALRLYPFPILDISDERSTIIMAAIQTGVEWYTLNEWLEKAGYPLLKVSPDMPSAKIGPVRSTVLYQDMINSNADEGRKPSTQRRFIKMKKSEPFVVAEHFGNAPFDFFYMAELELTADDGRRVYTRACFWPDGTSAYMLCSRSVQEVEIDEDEPLELYESLEDASISEYFPYFLELDRLTDQKAVETMAVVRDTKNYGLRISGHFTNDGIMMYGEAYNAQCPELNEYIQIRQTPTGYIYSASRKSYYMQMELEGLEDIYRMCFGVIEKPLYLFEIKTLDDLGPYEHYRESFEIMLGYMKRQFNDEQEREEC